MLPRALPPLFGKQANSMCVIGEGNSFANSKSTVAHLIELNLWFAL